MIAWYVCVLVTTVSAIGFFMLGALFKEKTAIETSKKLRQKLDNQRDTILRYLDTLRYIIDDKIVTDKKLAEHYKDKDVSLAYINRGLVKEWEITKADLEALIRTLSIQ